MSQTPAMSTQQSVDVDPASGLETQDEGPRRSRCPRITVQSPSGKTKKWSPIPSAIDNLTHLYFGNETLNRYRYHKDELLCTVTDRMYRQICASNEAAIGRRARMSEPSKLYNSVKSAAMQALTTTLACVSLWWNTFTPPVHDYLRHLPYIKHLYPDVPLPTPEEQTTLYKALLYRDSLSRNDWHRRTNAAVKTQFNTAIQSRGRRPASNDAARHMDTHLRYIHRTDYLVAVLGLRRPGGEGCHRFRRNNWRRRFFALDQVIEANAEECAAAISDFCVLKSYIAGLGIFRHRPASAVGVAEAVVLGFERGCEEYLAACVFESGFRKMQWPAVLRYVPHHVKGLHRREGASSRLAALL